LLESPTESRDAAAYVCDWFNTWSPTANMAAAHSAGKATNLANGTVLVAGGFSNVAEVYNPQTNQWPLTGPMPHASPMARSWQPAV